MKALKWMAGIFGVFVLLALVGGMFPPESPSERAEVARIEAETAAVQETIREIEAGPKLELLALLWTDEHGYETVEGLVKNISGESLEAVQAVATFKTKDGTFITSDSAMIEYNPILPGQESPFKVMTRSNPAMASVAPAFKVMFGGEIPTKDSRKKK